MIKCPAIYTHARTNKSDRAEQGSRRDALKDTRRTLWGLWTRSRYNLSFSLGSCYLSIWLAGERAGLTYLFVPRKCKNSVPTRVQKIYTEYGLYSPAPWYADIASCGSCLPVYLDLFPLAASSISLDPSRWRWSRTIGVEGSLRGSAHVKFHLHSAVLLFGGNAIFRAAGSSGFFHCWGFFTSWLLKWLSPVSSFRTWLTIKSLRGELFICSFSIQFRNFINI